MGIILLIALALSADSFIVSIAKGMTVDCQCRRRQLTMASMFAITQALMPLIGWLLGNSFRDYITTWDHWVAFLLLLIVGGKLIADNWRSEQSEKQNYRFTTISIQAIATSIDALVVGLTISMLNINIYLSVISIGVVTFIASFVGIQIGLISAQIKTRLVGFLGGAILIGIGVKTLIEHTLFN